MLQTTVTRQAKLAAEALRHIGRKPSLALCFLAFVLLIGVATFPQSVTSLSESAHRKRISLQNFTEPLDQLYRGMLDFDAPGPLNKGTYINLQGLIARLIGQRAVNEQVKLDNGRLTWLRPSADFTSACEQIAELYRRQTAAGKAFLFVLAPNKNPVDRDMLPAGYDDFSDQNGDALLRGLRQSQVPYLDLRESMRKDGLNWDDAFYITDHHWKPETAFWAYTKILDALVAAGTISPVDPTFTDVSQLQAEVFERAFLGTHGKRTGRYFAGVDDFTILTPKYDTHMTTEIIERGVKREGTFAQATLDRAQIRDGDAFQANPYAAFGFGNPGLVQYRNLQAPIRQNVLCICDSFGNVLLPFVALAFQGVADLDVRFGDTDLTNNPLLSQAEITIVMLYTGMLDTAANLRFFPSPSEGAQSTR